MDGDRCTTKSTVYPGCDWRKDYVVGLSVYTNMSTGDRRTAEPPSFTVAELQHKLKKMEGLVKAYESEKETLREEMYGECERAAEEKYRRQEKIRLEEQAVQSASKLDAETVELMKRQEECHKKEIKELKAKLATEKEKNVRLTTENRKLQKTIAYHKSREASTHLSYKDREKVARVEATAAAAAAEATNTGSSPIKHFRASHANSHDAQLSSKGSEVQSPFNHRRDCTSEGDAVVIVGVCNPNSGPGGGVLKQQEQGVGSDD